MIKSPRTKNYNILHPATKVIAENPPPEVKLEPHNQHHPYQHLYHESSYRPYYWILHSSLRQTMLLPPPPVSLLAVAVVVLVLASLENNYQCREL
mmetsp:Transcript_32500/g.66315  ORF Transcript_32500/g.66315 Transcript_32500/m.66315 type:complete len:95 (+) Transcript_32500:345-629(+)